MGNHGYGYFYINKRCLTTHRASYEHFVAPIPKGKYVCHRCDVKTCINPDHLFLGTNNDNVQDMVRKRRNRTKLTHEEVLQIRSLVGVSKAELARAYGVTDVMIGKIVRGEWWKQLLEMQNSS